MIFLVTTQTGHQRLIGSQQESLSGGALQFYVRKRGELRLQSAIAAGCWKESEAISKSEAQRLITEGIQHDRATLAYLEGKLETITDEPAQEPPAKGATGPRPVNQGEFKTRWLGKDSQGRSFNVRQNRYGIKLAVQPQNGDLIWVKIPDDLDPQTLTFKQAQDLLANNKPKRRSS